MGPDSDPYAVLGVPRDATSSQIAKARRRLSREYHPDVNSDPDAAARFVEIQQAFELLSDPSARAEYDRTGRVRGRGRGSRGQQAARGIFVEPASVDFGLLKPGESATDAEVTVSWTGTPPTRIESGPGNDWWTNLRAAMPDPSCVVFCLRAQAVARAANGRQQDQFTVTLDDTTVAVRLTAEIRGVPPPSPPPVFEAQASETRASETKISERTGRIAAPRRVRVRSGSPGPAILVLFTLIFTVLMTVVFHVGGNSQGLSASATPPPVRPVRVPQAQAAALNVRPVFHDGAESTQLTGVQPGFTDAAMVGVPVQRGFEILLPFWPLPNSQPSPSFCVDVTVSDAAAGPAQGMTFVESPVGTVIVHGMKELAYPAVIPGTYSLDTDCEPADNTTDPLILGSVTIPNLGVTTGLIENAMVVLGAHTSGDVTTVTYGAVGNRNFGSLNPPADDACIDSGGTPDTTTYWQPVQDLVSQQVNGRREWFRTGTLVFRDSHGQRPRGYFYYNCGQDSTPHQLSGIAVP